MQQRNGRRRRDYIPLSGTLIVCFFCHLVLECLLKALVCQATKKEAPYIHNLVRLAEYAHLELSDIQKDTLKVISTFNLRARYEEYKMAFHKRATSAFTEEYFNHTRIMKVWLSRELQKRGHRGM